MKCYRCGSVGIYNEANHKPFYYCKTCKDEIYVDRNLDPNYKLEKLDTPIDEDDDYITNYDNLDAMVFQHLSLDSDGNPLSYMRHDNKCVL